MRSSKQRDAVLEVLKTSCDHPTADVIFSRVRQTIPNISLGTVYRDLSQLQGEGLITVVESSNSKVRYEGNLEEHIHFCCKSCGNVIDVFAKTSIPKALTDMGLTVLSQKTVYYGICDECNKNIKNLKEN